MTFQDLGSIGEFVAAIATLGTLFYLALQIRQNSRSVRSAAFQSAVDGINQINNAVAQDESLARILRLGNEDQSNLTEDERVRYGFAYLSTFRCLETMYFHYREGTGTKLWEAASKHITALLSHSGSREWWSGNPYEFTNEFKQLVDEQIAAIQVSHARHE